MGKPPPAVKNEAKPGSTIPSSENMELLLGSRNLMKTELQPQSRASTKENPTSRPELPTKSSSGIHLKRRARKYTAVVRRSARISNSVLPSQTQEIVFEDLTVRESEHKEEQPAYQENISPEPTSAGKNLEENIDYLIQLLEAQEKTIKSLKMKATKNSVRSEGPSAFNVRYKSYIMESQKRIKALIEENQQLAQKLDVALSKIEAYENGAHAFSQVFDKLKDVILISNFTSIAEMTVNASSQAIRGPMSPREQKTSAAKSKKVPYVK